jgi:hypothetical protein
VESVRKKTLFRVFFVALRLNAGSLTERCLRRGIVGPVFAAMRHGVLGCVRSRCGFCVFGALGQNVVVEQVDPSVGYVVRPPYFGKFFTEYAKL